MPVKKYQEFIPHSTLQDSVKRFWILEKEYTAEDGIEEVTPDAYVELILNVGSTLIGSTVAQIPQPSDADWVSYNRTLQRDVGPAQKVPTESDYEMREGQMQTRCPSPNAGSRLKRWMQWEGPV